MKTSLLLLLLGVTAWAQDVKPDEREDFEANAYLGLAVDAFTAQVQRDVIYGNPQDNGTKRERMIGGFDFAYRFFGTKDNAKKPQLWLYGETLHGVRSAEVDCTATGPARPPVCAISDNVFNRTPTDPTKQLIYLLRNASSLEAHAGLRFEFLPLNPNGNNPARLYFKAEAGFLSIAQSGGDVYDVHRFGVGALSTGGRFAGSYFEIGYGRNDVFQLNRYRRGIVDGMLTWGNYKKVRPFVQMVLDSDIGKGADSVQSFVGLTFDLNEIF